MTESTKIFLSLAGGATVMSLNLWIMFRLAKRLLSEKSKIVPGVLLGVKFAALLVLVSFMVQKLPIHTLAFGFGIAMVPFLLVGISWKNTSSQF